MKKDLLEMVEERPHDSEASNEQEDGNSGLRCKYSKRNLIFSTTVGRKRSFKFKIGIEIEISNFETATNVELHNQLRSVEQTQMTNFFFQPSTSHNENDYEYEYKLHVCVYTLLNNYASTYLLTITQQNLPTYTRQ